MARLSCEEVEKIKTEMSFDLKISIAMKENLNPDARAALADGTFAPNLVRTVRGTLDPYLTAYIANHCRMSKDIILPRSRDHRKHPRFAQQFSGVVRTLVGRCAGPKATTTLIRKRAKRVERFIVEIIRRTTLRHLV